MTKTITINGVAYREAKVTQPIKPPEEGAICAQCAFFKDRSGCVQAINGSEAVFGGDCMSNDVVYAPKVAA